MLSLVNADDNSPAAREMVLRTLDRDEQFASYHQILDSLARAVGLFPYMNTEELDLRDAIAYEFHRPPNIPAELVFHREQAKIYQRLLAGDGVVLSTPTSFGKGKITDAIIANGKFDNIAIIVPTLALIDETRRRLASNPTNSLGEYCDAASCTDRSRVERTNTISVNAAGAIAESSARAPSGVE